MARWPKRHPRPGVDDYGRTTLWYAAANAHIERLNEAIHAGEDPSVGDDVGYTPLHVAVQNGHFEIVETLLAAGVALNSQDKHGNSPLWTAVMQARLDLRTEANLAILRLLLESGANADHSNGYGKSPRDAAAGGDPIVAALFSSAVDSSRTEIAN
jgi:ankyrin repeat protein